MFSQTLTSLDTFKLNLIQDLEARSVVFPPIASSLDVAIEAIENSSQPPRQLLIRNGNKPYQLRIQANRYGKINRVDVVPFSGGRAADAKSTGLLKRMVNGVCSAVQGTFRALGTLIALPFVAIAAIVKGTVELVQAVIVTALVLPIIALTSLVLIPLVIVPLAIVTAATALPILAMGSILIAPLIVPILIINSVTQC